MLIVTWSLFIFQVFHVPLVRSLVCNAALFLLLAFEGERCLRLDGEDKTSSVLKTCARQRQSFGQTGSASKIGLPHQSCQMQAKRNVFISSDKCSPPIPNFLFAA